MAGLAKFINSMYCNVVEPNIEFRRSKKRHRKKFNVMCNKVTVHRITHLHAIL